MARRPTTILSTAILDSLPHLAAALAIGVCLTSKSRDARNIFSVLVAFGTPMVTGVWMMLRIGGMMRRLANREWRESLALTFMRPEEFLLPRLLPRFIWLLAPLAVVPPFLLLIHVAEIVRAPLSWRGNDFVGFVVACVMLAAEAAAAAVVSVCGALDLLLRLCRARAPGLLAVGVPFVWCAILIAGPFVFIAITVMMLGIGEWAGFGLACAAGWGFVGAMALDARRRWRILLAAYCDVETIGAGPEEKLLPAPSAEAETRRIVLLWIAANAIANFAATLFTYERYGMFGRGVSPQAAGLVAGALDGIAQYFVLRRRVRNAGWWIAITAFVGLLGAAIRTDLLAAWGSDSGRGALDIALIVGATSALIGGIAGVAQGALFPRRARSAAIWGVSCAAANLMATLAFMAISPLSQGGRGMEMALVSSVLAGIVFGAATARPLLYLIKQPIEAAKE